MEQEQNNSRKEQRRLHGDTAQSPQAQPEKRAKRRVFRCANCEIEFFWTPIVAQNQIYCCTGCAAGGPCNCDYSLYRSVTIAGIIYYEW